MYKMSKVITVYCKTCSSQLFNTVVQEQQPDWRAVAYSYKVVIVVSMLLPAVLSYPELPHKYITVLC